MADHMTEDIQSLGFSEARLATGSELLMRAVLLDALNVYERGFTSKSVTRRSRANEVAVWVASDDTDWPFSFENVCTCLGIDPGCVREKLRAIRRKAFDSPKEYAADTRQESRPNGHADRALYNGQAA